MPGSLKAAATVHIGKAILCTSYYCVMWLAGVLCLVRGMKLYTALSSGDQRNGTEPYRFKEKHSMPVRERHTYIHTVCAFQWKMKRNVYEKQSNSTWSGCLAFSWFNIGSVRSYVPTISFLLVLLMIIAVRSLPPSFCVSSIDPLGAAASTHTHTYNS